ncbi:type VI secretion system Vgr family protein [Sorangium sp. So ce388]|uniref:type VI secretion system Vgr family protein n=1 Tax=Sorangium sp. So ce388 TaxID=3133309 RepID=UPI003F5BF8E5
MAQTLGVVLDCPDLQGEWLVASAVVLEAISEPTRATVRLVASGDVGGSQAIGAAAHLRIDVDGEAVRHFHLIVVGFELEGMHHASQRRYTVELAHELHRLSLRSNVRVFQDKTAKDIAAEVLDGAKIPASHVSYDVQRSLTRRAYCVQYRETDFAFISRLLEHEGIFYFIHDDDPSTHVIFSDVESSFPPIEGDTAIGLVDDDRHGQGIWSFSIETSIAPARSSVGDYNFEAPGVELTADYVVSGGDLGDRFEFAAGHATPDEGQVIARLRGEAIAASAVVARGRSDRIALRAGSWFELEGPSRETLGGRYLIRGVEHRLVVRSHDGREEESYENSFSCLPHAVAFRAPCTTPRPRMRGLHSAVVTGSGGEIHTDRLGRMKGKLFWDRLGPSDDRSSCWIRVVQIPIGGSMALARVGWEMALAYFDGDPDRPIAIARLYNAEKTSPYTYPAAATRMALQTASSPASGRSNEIRMEDGGGGMELFINAAKDYDGQTNNNKKETIAANDKLEIGVDGEVTIGASQTVSVGGSASTTVSADAGIQVGADRTTSVGGAETVSVGGNLAVVVKGSDTELVGGSHTVVAAMGIDKTSTGDQSLTVGGSMLSAAGVGVATMVAGAKSETVGGAKISVSGAAVTESVVGALATTVGGVCVQAAGGNRVGGTKGVTALTVGGVACANAGGRVSVVAKSISVKVLGVANLLGGGGVLNMTPGSVAFVGLITLDASGSIKISGNPNLVG